MLKELQEDWRMPWKLYKQNGNINEEIENLKKKQKNSEVKKYINWNEKFTREIQSQIWEDKRKNQPTWR